MKITRLPTGEYFIQKSKTERINSFEFIIRADKNNIGKVPVGPTLGTPFELIGKKIMFRVMIVDEEVTKK